MLEDAPEWARTALEYAAIILAIGTALSLFLESLVPRLRAVAARTEWEGDDRAVSWLAKVQGGLANAMEAVQAFIPRAALGKPPVKRVASDQILLEVKVDSEQATKEFQRLSQQADDLAKKVKTADPKDGAS